MPIVIILSLIVFEVLLIFVHLAVYGMLVAAFGIGSVALGWVFVALALTFLVASLLTHWFKGWLVDWFYTAAAYWFGLVHFLFFGGVLFFFTSEILYAHDHYVAPALLGGIFFGAFFLLHCYGTWLAGRAEITKIKVTLPGLPVAWQGKNIVFVSDVHLGGIRGVGFATKVVNKIMALRPEAVFIGGDLYDGVACDERALIEPLRSLKAPLGVYFITGNHEYYLPDPSAAFKAIRDIGIRILDNETIDLKGLSIFGVDDKTSHEKGEIQKLFKNVHFSKDKPAILLKHEPNHLELACDAGIALGFFGHTHEGQIFPLNLITRQMYNGFDYGLKQLGDMQVYTSSGVGTWGPPLRLGTKSEIVLVELNG
jgi:predicted MPP superfamily phosphohydrolase